MPRLLAFAFFVFRGEGFNLQCSGLVQSVVRRLFSAHVESLFVQTQFLGV